MNTHTTDTHPPLAPKEYEALSEDNKLYRIRHTLAHVMARAVLEHFPDAQCAIGPPIKNGFYYDFLLSRPLTQDDLARIEESMKNIIKKGTHTLIYETHEREQALTIFSKQQFKKELIENIQGTISTYTVDGFVDLCKGPHVPHTGYIDPKGFALLSVAGAYWKGDENKPMLQRIYATAWATRKDLVRHLEWLKEIKKRDHRKIGAELDLFSIHEEAGAGLIYWHPLGARLRTIVEDYWRTQHYASGYELVYTPHIGKKWLWEKSGHLEFYKENMFPPMEMDATDYYAKPMNCPFHIMIYKNKLRSYRDLPLRWGELGTVYRYERSGVLHGLLRVRGFTQDDAHLFCTPAQMASEIERVLRFSLSMWKDFGFNDIQAYLATKPPKAVGKEEDWEQATIALKKAAQECEVPLVIDEGGGAFYGPKIDLKIKDSIGREWQMSTIQFDFNLPERFDMHFVDSDGVKKRPYMIHRALLGSIERFFGVLIEHYAGKFPLWLAPIQIALLPLASDHQELATEYRNHLEEKGLRVSLLSSDERVGARIRTAQKKQIPLMLVLGDDEKKSRTVSIRTRGGRQVSAIPFETFVTTIVQTCRRRNNNEDTMWGFDNA